MPRAWIKPFCQHAQSLFGLPVKYLSIAALQMLLQIKAVHGAGPGVCSDFTLAMEQWRASDLTEHPLQGWLMRGALKTRYQTFNTALREKWVRTTRSGRVQSLPWHDIKNCIKRLHSTHVQVAKDELVSRLNYTCSSLEVSFLRRLKRGLLIEATKRIARFSPAGAI
eukprot:5342296-Amphidinium_carterae.2